MGWQVSSLEQGLMTATELISFPVNMELPQNYVNTLIDMAEEANMTAEQLARNCVAALILFQD
jgi:hypothetical protein